MNKPLGGENGVIPLWVEGMTLDAHFGKLVVWDFDGKRVSALVQLGMDGQAGRGGDGSDQIDDQVAAGQGTAAPVPGDVAEHPMLDLVPLARPRWEMTDANPQTDGVGQQLQRPQPQTTTNKSIMD